MSVYLEYVKTVDELLEGTEVERLWISEVEFEVLKRLKIFIFGCLDQTRKLGRVPRKARFEYPYHVIDFRGNHFLLRDVLPDEFQITDEITIDFVNYWNTKDCKLIFEY